MTDEHALKKLNAIAHTLRRDVIEMIGVGTAGHRSKRIPDPMQCT